MKYSLRQFLAIAVVAFISTAITHSISFAVNSDSEAALENRVSKKAVSDVGGHPADTKKTQQGKKPKASGGPYIAGSGASFSSGSSAAKKSTLASKKEEDLRKKKAAAAAAAKKK